MGIRWTIYCHTHIDSGRRYVGLTKKTFLQRWNQHVYTANKTKSGKGFSHFANAIRKYGKDAFSHEVLETCASLEVANLAEECWIELFDTRNPREGFNLTKGGAHTPHPIRKNPWDDPQYRESVSAALKARWEDPYFREKSIQATRDSLGTPESKERRRAASKEVHSRPEVQRKLSEAAKGRPKSSKQLAAFLASCVGRPVKESTRKKLRDNLLARGHEWFEKIRNPSPETRFKLSEATKKHPGTITPEMIRKSAEARRGKPLSPEHKAKIGAKSRARKHRPESKAKISAANSGRKHSKEAIQKMVSYYQKKYEIFLKEGMLQCKVHGTITLESCRKRKRKRSNDHIQFSCAICENTYRRKRRKELRMVNT